MTTTITLLNAQLEAAVRALMALPENVRLGARTHVKIHGNKAALSQAFAEFAEQKNAIVEAHQDEEHGPLQEGHPNWPAFQAAVRPLLAMGTEVEVDPLQWDEVVRSDEAEFDGCLTTLLDTGLLLMPEPEIVDDEAAEDAA